MQEPARVAKDAVREELEGIQRTHAAEHPAPNEDEPAMLEHAHLAAVLVLEVASRAVPGAGLGVVDRTHTVLHGHVGEGEVVSEARVDLDVVGPAHGVDGPFPP